MLIHLKRNPLPVNRRPNEYSTLLQSNQSLISNLILFGLKLCYNLRYTRGAGDFDSDPDFDLDEEKPQPRLPGNA